MFLVNYSIPLKESTFACRIFDLPVQTDYHVIASKPINYKHKLLGQVAVYGCSKWFDLFSFVCGILFTDEFCDIPTPHLFVDPNSGEMTRKSVFECSSSVAKPCQDLIAIMDQGEMDQGNCFPRDVGLLIGKTGYKQVLMKVNKVSILSDLQKGENFENLYIYTIYDILSVVSFKTKNKMNFVVDVPEPLERARYDERRNVLVPDAKPEEV